MDGNDPQRARLTKEAKEKQNENWQKLCRLNPRLVGTNLTKYERFVLENVITPFDMNVKFTDIGGLDNIVEELVESVIYPLTTPEIFESSSLLEAPSGVLLYGPPGCGKTMIAKALAKESGANFISIRMSSIMDKWYGESNKIVDAIFSLANKVQPCIIFIDEIDSFLRERSSTDHEVTAVLKAEFMTLWDGLVSNGRIMVLGATNRMNDIDAAFLRRMPKRFHVGLPDHESRKKILTILLNDTKLEETDFNMDMIVAHTNGFSGSDLKELCRNAALNAARDYIKDKKAGRDTNNGMRPLQNKDFFNVNNQLGSKPFADVRVSNPVLD
ncbi:protein-degrading AAA family ATPase MSP1 SCDLUD_000637 [Saccharomycodes ludwigii]|nr:hypothetical protein SCDLUD_000637 [Saccharomycodes ludwigii]KAH3903029.1 hypothetical protein SCDLUD_000637 [Saccharomycodes ludwigii]